MTANDFAASALRLLGVIGTTDTPSAEDADAAFDVLNLWIDGLGVQRQSLYYVARTTKTLTSGTASYTVGSGGNINIVRPVWIQNVGFILDTTVTDPIEIPIGQFTDDDWAALTPKSLASSVVEGIYYDYNWSAGLGRIYVWPIPNVSTTQLVLYTPTALAEFADLSTDYTFPPGYKRAILYNLANELAPWYPAQTPDPRIATIARDSLAQIKRANWRPSVVTIDHALTRNNRGATVTASQFASGNF